MDHSDHANALAANLFLICRWENSYCSLNIKVVDTTPKRTNAQEIVAMIKNFHFKMLIGLALYSFVMSAIFLAAGFRSNSHQLSSQMGGVFSAIGLFATITAGAIKSISYRLDKAGIAEDPKFPTSHGKDNDKKANKTEMATPRKPSD